MKTLPNGWQFIGWERSTLRVRVLIENGAPKVVESNERGAAALVAVSKLCDVAIEQMSDWRPAGTHGLHVCTVRVAS